MSQPSSESSAPFGSKPRDLVFVYRAVVFILTCFSATSISVMLYAGNQYIKNEASAIVTSQLERSSEERKLTIKEWNEWRAKKDEVDIRMTVIMENLQVLLARQQAQLDNIQAAQRK